MTRAELRASGSLAMVFALRMLGLFLILPVFAVHARGLPGGDQPLLVGLALGVYGLTQAFLQIPYGIASDRFGRKPVIVAGMLVFAAGSFLAAVAPDVMTVLIGRALQGAGAVSAAVTAMIADHTRDSQRTKAMAMVGISIGMSFAVSMVAAPLLYSLIGMAGIFSLTGLLALAAVVTVTRLPAPPADAAQGAVDAVERRRFRDVLAHVDLLRLNFGVFVLHAVQMAVFVVVPNWLVEDAGLPLDAHWKLYLPVMAVSVMLMMPALNWGERRGRVSTVLAGAIGLMLVVVIGLFWHPRGVIPMAILLAAFFAGFNVLEASQPSLVSKLAPPGTRGAALGVYNTTQSLGLFVGGGLGGWALASWGGQAVFAGSGVLLLAWLIMTLRKRVDTPGSVLGSSSASHG
ncbi:MAG: MFS transporter [Burkholderiaceae bacterium]